ncbi:MAG: DUF1461 domain-containing protein [Solirubrobacterales bacterium]
MFSKPGGLAAIVVTIAVPLVILGNAMVLLLFPTMPAFQYSLPGFPDDPLGLAGQDRVDLAVAGVKSIWPVGAGEQYLRDARLPEGGSAYTDFEIDHMNDVRSLIRWGLGIWLVSLVALCAAAMSLAKQGRQYMALRAAGRGLIVGGVALAAVGLLMLVAYDFFFDGFHNIFFAAGTWNFADEFTLRRIYPDAFWVNASAAFVVLALIQGTVLGLVVRGAAGTAGSPGRSTP